MSRDYDYDDLDDFYDYDFAPTRRGAGKWVALFVLIVLLIAALGAIIVKVYDIVPAPDTGDDVATTTTVAPSTTTSPTTEAPATTAAPVTTVASVTTAPVVPPLPDGPIIL